MVLQFETHIPEDKYMSQRILSESRLGRRSGTPSTMGEICILSCVRAFVGACGRVFLFGWLIGDLSGWVVEFCSAKEILKQSACFI